MDIGNAYFKILIIDDERHIRQSFADFLEDQDYEVILAENGRIGLEKMAEQQPDLILLDLRMPELDGLEVLQRGRKIMPDVPMIVISGANRIGDVVRALRYGAWDYLEKPVHEFSILKHAVTTALERARLIKENKSYQEHLENMVLERTRELEETNQNLANINARLHKIVDTTQNLACCVNMEQFSLKTLDEFATHMAATGGSLYILEDQGLRLMHSLDPGHAIPFLEFPLIENSILNNVLKEKQPILIKDIEGQGNVVTSGWSGYPDGSLLAFPILDSDTSVIGIITLHNKRKPPFIDQDKEIGTILASYCCETLRAIKAFESVQKSEAQLRQSQKMEAIGTLAGGIAHDFNNILSGIIGYAQLIEMSTCDPDSIKKNTDQILQGAGRASELVNQILTFSRQIEYEKKPLKLYLIVKEAVKFLRSSIPATITIKEQIDSKSLVLADATQIHQVAMNLCTNAYHAMHDTGGTLSISLTDTMVDAKMVEECCQPGLYVKFEIEDTGHGIDKENLERIFDPYFTTKKVSQGTGLGLAVVKGIVKKHNGFVKVSSQIGSGTVFQIFFPTQSELSQGEPAEKSQENRLGGKERIMIVDDEKAILDTTQAILERMGYSVAQFLDGLSALDEFKKDPMGFDLIITDMTMPKMEGSTLTKEILAIQPDIPVILCTGFHEAFTEEAALEIGIRRYVQKPVAGRDLALIIREELDKKRDRT